MASRGPFLFQNLRSVPFGIDQTEESERFVKGVFQLVGFPGLDIQSVKIANSVFLTSGDAYALSSYPDDHMFMPVRFEAAVAIRSDLKIPEMEFGRFTVVADKCLPDDIGPIAAGRFISFPRYFIPSEIPFISVKPGLIFRIGLCIPAGFLFPVT